jgi:hypothetical protein
VPNDFTGEGRAPHRARQRHEHPRLSRDLGFGRIGASEVEAPNNYVSDFWHEVDKR